VRAVRHRDGEPRTRAGALADEERGEDLVDGAERAGGEVGHLHRGPPRRGVVEHARPALVVEVVARALLVPPSDPEARDRADHGPLGHVLGSDPQPCEHAGPEGLQHDVRPPQEAAQERRVAGQVADDRLLAGVQGVVPPGRRLAHRVAARLLDPHDARSESQQLASLRRRPADSG